MRVGVVGVNALGDDWAGRVIAAVAVGIPSLFVAWMGGRRQFKADIKSEARKASETACRELTGVVGVLREEIDRIRADQLAERHECDIKLKGLQLQIDAFMSGPIAPYGGK